MPATAADYRASSAIIILILLVALFFRTYDLTGVPPGLDGDEMFNGWDAARVWKGNLHAYFPANYGREPLQIYLMALAIRLLGVRVWALRLTSVLGGLAGILFTWTLAVRLFNRRVAALTTALQAVSLWPVLLSRVALRAVFLPTCETIALYALWRTLEERSVRMAVMAGLFGGLTLYTYTSARAFPLVPLLWLPTYLLTAPAAGRAVRRLMLAALVAVLVVLPLARFALVHPTLFNQRVHALDFELNRLRSGDLAPLLTSVWQTARMFTQTGDHEWRYNFSGRPIFDPLTGLFFYVGLLVALFRLRRPAYSLVLIWLAVMLLPTILSIGTPSFWRASGALPPIYLLPALGADFLYQRLLRPHWPAVSRLAAPAVAAGLLLLGGDTWHAYFDEWARHPQVIHTYEADLAAAARYLNEYTPSDTPVWVSSDYPSDLSRILLGLQTTYPGPIRWFDGNLVTVWPAGWAGRDVLLLFTQSSPPNPDARAVLGDYLIYRENDGAGRPQLWVYRIPGAALSRSPWQPEHRRGGRFAYNREIVGYDAPTQVRRQSAAVVTIYWRVPPDVQYDLNDLPFSFVCLRDAAAGRCLDEPQAHYVAYPPWDWTTGDLAAQRYTVTVPAYLLPQTGDFHVGMFTSRGEISFADEEHAGVPLLIGPVEVTGTATLAPQWDADTPILNGDLALTGYHVPDTAPPGSTVQVELHWQAVRPPAADYAVRLELRSCAADGPSVAVEEVLGAPRHPTGRWVGGEPAYTFHDLRLPPDLGNGECRVTLTLLTADTRRPVAPALTLGTLAVSGRPHNFALPMPQHPLTATFGSVIRLLGFDFTPIEPAPGGQVAVVLYWQAIQTMDADYKVFVHLYDPTAPGMLIGQRDSPPGNGEFPTSGWLPGEVVTDSYTVPIEPDAPQGESAVGVGLYLPTTGERLPVTVDGVRQPNDVLIITAIEIR